MLFSVVKNDMFNISIFPCTFNKKKPFPSLLRRRLCGFLAPLRIFESNSELVFLWYHFFHRAGPREKRREKRGGEISFAPLLRILFRFRSSRLSLLSPVAITAEFIHRIRAFRRDRGYLAEISPISARLPRSRRDLGQIFTRGPAFPIFLGSKNLLI